MKICVYCSASPYVDQFYFEQIKSFGFRIAEHGYVLVYGGDHVGLMGKMMETVLKAKGRIIGIIPRKLYKKRFHEKFRKKFEKMIITKDIRERKKIMQAIGDAFVCFPGGFGTLSEILETVNLKQLGYHNKPIILVNINNYFNDLINLINKAIEQNFIKKDGEQLFYTVNDSNSIFEILKYVYREDKEVV